MIAIETVCRVRELLAAGELSQREIARKLELSRGTVSAIATGRRTDRVAKPRPGEEPPLFAGPYLRCRGCGGMVQMPCLLCRVRALRPSRIASRHPGRAA